MVTLGSVSSQSSEPNAAEESDQSSTTASTVSASQAPPGMSVVAVKRVTGDTPLEPNKLEQVHVYD